MKTLFTLLFLTAVGSSYGSSDIVSLSNCQVKELSRRVFHTENSSETIIDVSTIECEQLHYLQCQQRQKAHVSREPIKPSPRKIYKHRVLMKTRSIMEYNGVVYSCGDIKGLL